MSNKRGRPSKYDVIYYRGIIIGKDKEGLEDHLEVFACSALCKYCEARIATTYYDGSRAKAKHAVLVRAKRNDSSFLHDSGCDY